MVRSCLYLLIALTLMACGDAPLLVTPLPNGYTFHSNGGGFGNIKNPDGLRLVEYFGIRNNGRETWCTEFSWQSDTVICKLGEYGQHGFDASRTEFFVLDTVTGEVIVFPDQMSVQGFWTARFNSAVPQLYRRYSSTRTE